MFSNVMKFANSGGDELIEEMLQVNFILKEFYWFIVKTLVYVTKTDAHLDLIESPQLFQGVIEFAKRSSQPE